MIYRKDSNTINWQIYDAVMNNPGAVDWSSGGPKLKPGYELVALPGQRTATLMTTAEASRQSQIVQNKVTQGVRATADEYEYPLRRYTL